MRYAPSALKRAISAIYPDIKERVVKQRVVDERHLWWELSCCILSSQVPYELAMCAADRIDEKGCLYDIPSISIFELESLLFELLNTPFTLNDRERRYRFPSSKARQLALTYSAINNSSSSLPSLLNSFESDVVLRKWLVSNASGIGPKQASMFLRNCGFTYDLAILDKHVLDYMSEIGLFDRVPSSVSSLNKYTLHETELKAHASELGCSVGLLDWAIWIVMRVSNKKEEFA